MTQINHARADQYEPAKAKVVHPAHAQVSRVKWYDPIRRFGFIQPHDNGGDIWFNWLTLLRNKIPENDVLPDMEVTYTFMIPDTPSKNRSVLYMSITELT